ncbi:hypothetical protein C8J57DRAFT_1227999 [Mycena rebaudengoi]|nr:hypothetical protein C8J57DRAFT_1227999 [Mycena rebaudengoi]
MAIQNTVHQTTYCAAQLDAAILRRAIGNAGGSEAARDEEVMDPDEIIMFFWSQNPAALERRKREAEDRKREEEERASRMDQWRESLSTADGRASGSRASSGKIRKWQKSNSCEMFAPKQELFDSDELSLQYCPSIFWLVQGATRQSSVYPAGQPAWNTLPGTRHSALLVPSNRAEMTVKLKLKSYSPATIHSGVVDTLLACCRRRAFSGFPYPLKNRRTDDVYGPYADVWDWGAQGTDTARANGGIIWCLGAYDCGARG